MTDKLHTKTHTNALGIKNPIHSSSNYIGTIIPDNYVVLQARTRDSSELEESNFQTALNLLGGESYNVRIDRFGSWACGWFEYLTVNKDHAKTYYKACDIFEALEDYPVLDEQDFSEREQESANRVWRDCYDVSERVEYIRENPGQFDFCGFPDMLSCCRGEYFAGYACDLIA